MKQRTLIVKDLAIANGVVARKPGAMSWDFWNKYEVPRIGKYYTKDFDIPYGLEYDIDKSKVSSFKPVAEESIEDGECVACHL